ncbi:uncharacterized protein LOC132284497 [Cornus florida]|uniref:uncharacterized protein LOC132284497 n=1 Tax=Cornus florida TaxID=4283 RepID=UPI0028A2490C|nr:uncharacterized protein LOC132284497 [Cornus florida]
MPSKSKQSLSNSGRQVSNGREERKPTSHVSNGREERKPMSHISNGREESKPMSKSTHMPPKAGSHRLTSVAKPNRTVVDSRKQLGSNSGNEPRRPLGSKGLPTKKPAAVMEKKGALPGAKSSTAGFHKPPSSKLQHATPKQSIESRKKFHEYSKGRMIPKHPVSSSKPQMNKVLPKIASRATLQEERPKKKPVRRYSDDEDDGDEAVSMIREMFGYDPKKFAGHDEDDSDMEANYADIMKEVKRSALIARKEDEEELRKIEEEERQERLRKKRKLSQR